MLEKMVLVLVNGLILLVVLMVQILAPRLSRKDILLGVRIPEDKIKTDEINNIIKGFIRENIIVGIPTLILISVVIYFVDNINFFIFSSFFYMGVIFVVYIRWNRKIKELKRERGWDQLASKIIAVDTKFSKDRGKQKIVSRKWFLIPLGLVLISVIMSLIMYPSLPDDLPIHWDLKGNVDGYRAKSLLTAMLMPINQLVMLIIMYLSYEFIIRAKQQIKSKDPEEYLKKNIISRNIWLIYLIISLIVLEVFFTLMNMASLGLISNMYIINILLLIVSGLMIIGAIVLGIKVGQGGERLKEGSKGETPSNYDIDDDNLWILGNSLYYNPDDSSIFVEKRVGVGWTVNIGRPIGMIIMVLPFIFLIVLLFRINK